MRKSSVKTAGKKWIAALSFAGAMALAGCGAKEPAQTTETEQAAEAVGADLSLAEAGTTAGSVEAAGESDAAGTGEPDDSEADLNESAQELQQAWIRHIYSGVLSQIVAAWQLPDGELDTSQLEAGIGEMRDNQFAITDIDGDGVEELIIRCSNATIDGMEMVIYGFDPAAGRLRRESAELPALMEGANEITIAYLPMEYESFADLTPVYLKLIADEAGKSRTDTEADLGLLILQQELQEGEFYLDAAESLLSGRYGVEVRQPYEDFDEQKVGLWNGQEVFTFTCLNAGMLDYHGERVEDVTIFGLYPGISADSAWEKLTAYGFYASPYGETDNCLVTGDGFGNISVWFSEEDGKVTQISVDPFCAFAG